MMDVLKKKAGISAKTILLMQAFAAVLMLSAAFVSQYGFKLYPCELCMLQRYPYMVIAFLGLLGAFLLSSPFWRVRLIYGCALLFAIDAGIALYHAGVELDIFQGPTACSVTQTGEQTLEQMRAAIMSAPLVSCKQPQAYFLGLSMAAWNGFAASLLAALSFMRGRYAASR